MTLGWKPALTNEVYEPFMRSGTIDDFYFSTTPKTQKTERFRHKYAPPFAPRRGCIIPAVECRTFSLTRWNKAVRLGSQRYSNGLMICRCH
jgi:hypothetical protein